MKVLIAIANFGTKNMKYLQRLIEEYHSMTRYEVKIVILSDIPKDLSSAVEVIVGLPTKNPWSLPFRHKALFAERMHQYDLFIYSEDDTLITERNIDSFVKVTQVLPDNYIAGFIRYEISKNRKKYYSTIHSHYHWDPNFVLKLEDYIFAHYTNDHSACFMLTQKQLKRAINSGGFLLPAREGRYDMLVTAATDPYTQCGMKKLICISHLADFSLHHLPNVYCGRIGVDSAVADLEIEKLKSLSDSDGIRGPLFETKTTLEDPYWNKKYYEPCRKDILSLVPNNVKRVLSVGCGCAKTEAEMVKKGIEVYGIPLDCVIQESAAANGIKILPPNFREAKKELLGEEFNCILFQDTLHHLPDAVSIIKEFLELLSENGSLIISVPNFNHPSVFRKRISGELPFFKSQAKHDFQKFKLHFTTKRILNTWLNKCGMKMVQLYRPDQTLNKLLRCAMLGHLIGILPRDIVLLAKRNC